MELNEYQKQAMTTCMTSCANLPYMLFNLQGEVGELSSKIAKAIRKGKIWFTDDDIDRNQLKALTTVDEQVEFEDAVIGELGDVLWQLAGVCDVLGFKLEDVAQHNLRKLASRKQRGVIDGNGDNR